MIASPERATRLESPLPSSDDVASSTGPPGWRDLVLTLGVGLAAWAVAAANGPALLRVPLGLLALVVAPGYALVAFVFPRRALVDRAERVALALGASFALITVQAYLLDRLGGGLQPDSILNWTTATTLVFGVGAAVRRRRAPRASITPAATDAPHRRSTSRAMRFTQAIVVVNILAAALAYALTIGGQPPAPTEFYALGSTDQLSDYPRDVVLGQPYAIKLGVNQTPARSGSYTITARRDDQVLATLGPVSVNAGGQWSGELALTPDRVGDDEEVTIVLDDGSAKPFRTLRLWVNVHDQAGQTG